MNDQDIAAILTGAKQGANNFARGYTSPRKDAPKPEPASGEWTPEAQEPPAPKNPDWDFNAGDPASEAEAQSMLDQAYDRSAIDPRVQNPYQGVIDGTERAGGSAVERVGALLTGQRQPSYEADNMRKLFNEKMTTAQQMGFTFGVDETGEPKIRHDFFQPHLIAPDGGV